MSRESRPRPALYGVKHAAQRLALSENRIRQLADSGALVAQRDSEGRRLFSDADINSFAARKR